MKYFTNKIFIGFGITLLFLLLLSGFFNWGNFLVVAQPVKPADVIIVLSGEEGERVDYAAQLFRAGTAPAILVTGGINSQGLIDGDLMLERLIRQGIPTNCISVERKALSTYENALFSMAMLVDQDNLQRIIIVTSPYHSRRSLACYRKVSKLLQFTNLEISSNPVPLNRSLFKAQGWWRDQYSLKSGRLESIKMAYYFFKYGVWSL